MAHPKHPLIPIALQRSSCEIGNTFLPSPLSLARRVTKNRPTLDSHQAKARCTGLTIRRVQSIQTNPPVRARRRSVVGTPSHYLARPTVALIFCAAVLSGCNKTSNDATAATAPAGSAQAQFNAMVEACTRTVAARADSIVKDRGGQWVKTGFSAALVQGEVNQTESAVTPFVGKIVVKDNHAQATAPSEAEARAIILAPVHLLSNRTHTFVYQFDGQKWQWNNGSLSIKTPVLPAATTAVTREALMVTGDGLTGCLPG